MFSTGIHKQPATSKKVHLAHCVSIRKFLTYKDLREKGIVKFVEKNLFVSEWFLTTSHWRASKILWGGVGEKSGENEGKTKSPILLEQTAFLFSYLYYRSVINYNKQKKYQVVIKTLVIHTQIFISKLLDHVFGSTYM